MSYCETKFKAADGIELHGRVYAATQEGPGPGLVLCPGFNCVLSMMNLPGCAAALQENNITVLLYDPRGIGASGGLPRNDIDPPQYVSDMSDALTYLLTLPSVDPTLAGVFGFSFGGSIALTTASIDPRCRFVIAAAPLTDLDFISPSQRTRVLHKCAQDKESQVRGNAAFTVPLVNERGENAVGFGHGVDTELYARLIKNGREIAPGHLNRVTLMSYYKIAQWTPWPLWKHLGTGDNGNAKSGLRGALFIVPAEDTMSYAAMQRKYFYDVDGGPGFYKSKVEVEGSGHEELFTEANLNTVVDGVVGFIERVSRDTDSGGCSD
ncbi:Alpha/Beta hydrolase protein [Xylariaceae sp. FL0662B]|nr:Alpha/Beta hydrolase protein [Xylariaceae sp. FL0662B]